MKNSSFRQSKSYIPFKPFGILRIFRMFRSVRPVKLLRQIRAVISAISFNPLKSFKAVLLVVFAMILSISLGFSAAAAEIARAFASADQVKIYLRGIGTGPDPNASLLIGNEQAEGLNSHVLLEDALPVRTLILLDNSLSIPQSSRSETVNLIKTLIEGHIEREEFRLAMFDSQIHYMSDYTNDYNVLKGLISNINYSNQDTHLTDVLYNVLNDPYFRDYQGYQRIILIADGVDNTRDNLYGKTRDELYNKLKENPFPVHSVGIFTGGNNVELENMFALSRLANSGEFQLGQAAPFQIASQINQDFGITVYECPIPDKLKTGSETAILLTLSDGSRLEGRIKLPFITDTNSTGSATGANPSQSGSQSGGSADGGSGSNVNSNADGEFNEGGSTNGEGVGTGESNNGKGDSETNSGSDSKSSSDSKSDSKSDSDAESDAESNSDSEEKSEDESNEAFPWNIISFIKDNMLVSLLVGGVLLVLIILLIILLKMRKKSRVYEEDVYTEGNYDEFVNSEQPTMYEPEIMNDAREYISHTTWDLPPRYIIRLTDTIDGSTVLQAPLKNEAKLGRASRLCSLVIPYDDSISREQCIIRIIPDNMGKDHFYIENLSTTNPTKLNASIVNQPMEIYSKDELKMGRVSVMVEFIHV